MFFVFLDFLYMFPASFNLLVKLEGLGIFPLDAARNSTRFGATNPSRALTAVQFRLATVSLQLFGISGACLYMLSGILFF